MKKTVLASLILSQAICLSNAYSGTMGPVVSDRTWVASFSAGPTWTDGGDTQTFYLTPDIVDTYVANGSNHTLAAGELFLGMQRGLPHQLLGQLGIAGALAGNAKYSGIIWDDADPLFDNYAYDYKVTHAHVALKGKILADRGYFLTPWVSASVGVGFNRAHGYNNVPLIFEAVTNPDFKDHTKTTFTYTVGAGLQKQVTTHWQVGAGYEFADWGKNNLGRAPGQTLNRGITMDHVYTNGVMFNLTYVA